MRKILILVFITLGLSFQSLGQEFLSKIIDFDVENAPIDQALDKLSEKTGIDIAYSKNFFRNSDPITIHLKQESVDNVLREILKTTSIQYKTLGENRVLLFKGKVAYQTLSGYVEDAETGERIVGARVFSAEHNIGGITNEYGFFSMELPVGKTKLIIRSIGFKANQTYVNIDRDKEVSFQMNPLENLPAIVVDAEDKNTYGFSSIATDQDNITEISPRLAEAVPSLNGQTDYVRVAELLPGIQGQSDGFGGINIRGGESGQNLMLMDGTPVYIPYHLLGLYSVYNPETVKSVKVVKGNFPARYGSAVSSVLDVRIREGNMNEWKSTAEVNLLNLGVCVEGPIKKNKGSILFAGRFSPRAYFFEPSIRQLYFRNQADEQKTQFYDFNIKANYKLSSKDRIYLSVFTGKDLIYQSKLITLNAFQSSFSTFDLDWRNTVGSLRWNHLFSKKLFLNTTATYSNYSHSFSSQEEFQLNVPDAYSYDFFAIDNRSDNVDLGLKMDFDYAISRMHKFRFGVHHNYRRFAPSFYYLHETYFDLAYEDEFGTVFDFAEFYQTQTLSTYFINENAIYFEDQIKLRRWYFNIGGRLSSNLGERLLDGISRRSNFFFFEPRLLSKYLINEKMNISASANRRIQYLHLVANQTLQLPNDVWIPSGENIDPQEMYELEVAYQYRPVDYLKLKLTGYYRLTNNLYTYPESIEFLEATEDYSSYEYLVMGTGTSRGLELFADYADEKRAVLFSYTLSKAERQFDAINLGLPYAANFDSRHQFTLSYYQNLTKSFRIGMNWVFKSPQPKINVVQYSTDGSISNIDEDPPGFKNTTRTSVYNRVDVNLQYNHKGEKVEHTLKFGVYNMFNAQNIVFYQFREFDPSGEIITTPLESLPILPSFSYRISF